MDYPLLALVLATQGIAIRRRSAALLDTDGDGVGDNADRYPDDSNRSEMDSHDSANVPVQDGIWLLLSMFAGFYYLWRRKQS